MDCERQFFVAGSQFLGLVDVCQKGDLREQSATGPRRTAQLRKENPLRLLSTNSVFLVPLRVPSWIKKVFSASLRVLRGQKGVLRGPSWVAGAPLGSLFAV